jgi:hypothetical protein
VAAVGNCVEFSWTGVIKALLNVDGNANLNNDRPSIRILH